MYRQHLSKDPYQGSVQHVLAWNITPSSQTQGIRGVIWTLSSDTETSFITPWEREYHTYISVDLLGGGGGGFRGQASEAFLVVKTERECLENLPIDKMKRIKSVYLAAP